MAWMTTVMAEWKRSAVVQRVRPLNVMVAHRRPSVSAFAVVVSSNAFGFAGAADRL